LARATSSETDDAICKQWARQLFARLLKDIIDFFIYFFILESRHAL
jgi:hypothetical protein